MSKDKLLSVSLITFSVFYVFKMAPALNCWKCTSEFPYTFCNEPFNATKQHKRWAYIECELPPNQLDSESGERNITIVCRKLKLLINEEYLIIRGCYWQYEIDECFYNTMASDIQVASCETCDFDGCNSFHESSARKINAFSRLSKLSVLLAVCHRYLSD